MKRNPHQITLISKETIKPSSPTPFHLKTYNLGELDLISPRVYIPLVFFYPNYGSTSPQEIATQLKKSLSQTLNQYYPFSGRFADGGSVDCNDEGVEFMEAEVLDAPLSELVRLHDSSYEPIDQFFPTGGVWGCDYTGSRSLVLFQLSHFSCGGLALAVSMSHKIADMRTLCAFVTHWAMVNQRNAGDQHVLAVPPHFISSPKSNNNLAIIDVPEFELNRDSKCVTKKFVFPNSKLTQLKAMVKDRISGEDENSVMDPTRVEVLNSLLLICAVKAAKANSGNSEKANVLTQALNLRKRMAPPLPETSVGNICIVRTIPTFNENELALNLITAKFRKMKMQSSGMTNSHVSQWITEEGEAFRNLTINNDVVVYWFISHSRFPLYEVDFGWGKPIRVTVAENPMKNVFTLMDTPNEDGIEALVCLDEKDMAVFQNDEQLLAFAL